MSDDIERLTEQVAQLTAVLNELRDQGHTYVGVMRSSATANQLVNERALQQSKATEESLKATSQTVADSMTQTIRSFNATAQSAGGQLAGQLGEYFGMKARAELDPAVHRLNSAVAEVKGVTEQLRARWSGFVSTTASACMVAAVFCVGLFVAITIIWDLMDDKAQLIRQLNEYKQMAPAAPEATKPKARSSTEKSGTGAR